MPVTIRRLDELDEQAGLPEISVETLDTLDAPDVVPPAPTGVSERERYLRGDLMLPQSRLPGPIAQKPAPIQLSPGVGRYLGGDRTAIAGPAPASAPQIRSPLESTSEVVREHAQRQQEMPIVRRAADAAARTLTGFGLDEIQRHIERGTLPETVSMKLIDPVGNVSEAMIRETNRRLGTDPKTTANIAFVGSLLLGILSPGGKKPRRIPASDDIAVMMSKAASRKPAKEVFRAAKDQLIETQVNKFQPLRQLTEAAGAAAGRGQAPIEVAELTSNRIGGLSQAFMIRMNRVIDKAKKLGVDAILPEYLFLKQAEKRIRDLAARTDTDVLATGRRVTGEFVNPMNLDQPAIAQRLAALDSKLTPAQKTALEEAAQGVWRLNRSILDRAHDVGIVSDETYATIVGRGDDYVPFQVLDYISEVGEGGAQRKALDIRTQNVVRRMEGTERAVRNPIAASLDRAQSSISTIERNRAARAVTDLAPVLPPGTIEQVPGDVFKVPGKTVISVFENGQRINYAVPDDIGRAMKGLNADQVGLLGKILSFPAQILRVGATGANVGFAITNLPRDFKRAALYSRYGFKSPADLVTFPLDWLRGLASVVKKDDTYLQALESGALFSTLQKMLTPDAFIRRAAGKKTMNPAMLLYDAFQSFNNAVEEATKMQTFIRGQRTGASAAEIAYEVANYGGSPNFARSGTMAQHLNLMWMFYNARLQGTAANVRRLAEKGDRASTLARIGALSLLPMSALWVYNSQFDGNHGLEELDPSEKDRFHIFLTPETYQAGDGSIRRKYYRIAKEETEQVMGSILEDGLALLAGDNKESLPKMMVDLLGNVAPIGVNVEQEQPGAWDVARAAGYGVLSSANPLVRIPTELAMNTQAYFQSPIVPRGLAEGKLPQEQVKPTTSPLAIEIGKILGVSPIRLEYLMTSGTGGLGQTALDIADTLSGEKLPATLDPYEQLARRPIFSRVMGRGGDEINQQTENRMYATRDEARRAKGSLKGLIDAQGDPARIQEIVSDPRLSTLIEYSGYIEKLARELGGIRKMQQAVTHGVEAPPEAKKAAIRALAEKREILLAAFRQVETVMKQFTNPVMPMGEQGEIGEETEEE